MLNSIIDQELDTIFIVIFLKTKVNRVTFDFIIGRFLQMNKSKTRLFNINTKAYAIQKLLRINSLKASVLNEETRKTSALLELLCKIKDWLSVTKIYKQAIVVNYSHKYISTALYQS